MWQAPNWVFPLIGVSILTVIACIPLIGKAVRGDFSRKGKSRN